MPEQFEECRKNPKAKIRRVDGPSEEHGLEAGQYVNYCITPEGKSVRGYVQNADQGGEQASMEGMG